MRAKRSLGGIRLVGLLSLMALLLSCEDALSAQGGQGLDAVRTLVRSGDLREALRAFDYGCGPFDWPAVQDYPAIKEVGIELAVALVHADFPGQAIRALSAVGRAGRNPVDLLWELQEELDQEVRRAIWPAAPYLVVEDFEGDSAKPLTLIRNAQRRELLANELSARRDDPANRCARLSFGASQTAGRFWYALDTPGLKLSDRPFGLQASLRSEAPLDPGMAVRYWLLNPDRAADTQHESGSPDEQGWRVLDTGADVYRLRRHVSILAKHDAERATILSVGFDVPEGPANTILFDDVQVYLPDDWRERLSKPEEEEASDSLPPGHWTPFRRGAAPHAMTDEERGKYEQLEALGYLGHTETVARGEERYCYHNTELAYPGYTFYLTGRQPEARLVDMEGKVLHTWQGDYASLWPDEKTPRGAASQGLWRRGCLLENGDILAIHEGRALVKLDKDSRVIWANRGGYHHDLEVQEDGSIYVLTRETKILPRLHAKEPVFEEFITILAPDGEILRQVSLLECFEDSYYECSFFNRMPPSGDIFHTNTIEVLDGALADRSSAFRAGNVLISVKVLETIAIVDLDLKKVVWALSGMWLRQHQPTVLDNGNILVFDNLGPRLARGGGEFASRVLELNPFTQEVVWEYRGNRVTPFFSETCGSNQRLPNGNTLVTETDNGRAFEVTPDGTIVWELVNPDRAGENDAFIAAIFEAIRLPMSFPLEWADGVE